jgi:hypothetical protein
MRRGTVKRRHGCSPRASDYVEDVSVPAWIPTTVAAAVFQVWRTALQSRLRESLTAGGAGFVRYLYALPLDLAMLLLA